jgi:hypothetical protein
MAGKTEEEVTGSEAIEGLGFLLTTYKIGVNNFRKPVKKSPFLYLCKDHG